MIIILGVALIIFLIVRAKRKHDRWEEKVSALPARDEWRARTGGID